MSDEQKMQVIRKLEYDQHEMAMLFDKWYSTDDDFARMWRQRIDEPDTPAIIVHNTELLGDTDG